MKEVYVIAVINYDSLGEWTDVHISGNGYPTIEEAQKFLKSRTFSKYWSDTMMYGYGEDSKGNSVRYNIVPIRIANY